MNVHFTSSHVQLSLFIFRGFVVLLSILAINLSLSPPFLLSLLILIHVWPVTDETRKVDPVSF